MCESADDFGEHDGLDGEGYVAILDAGAYGFTMASRYNGRGLPAEVFVSGGRVVAVGDRDGGDSWVRGRVELASDLVQEERPRVPDSSQHPGLLVPR